MTQLSSAIRTLFTLWWNTFSRGTCVLCRLLKLGINLQLYFIFFLSSWRFLSFYVLQWFSQIDCLVQEIFSSRDINLANLSFHRQNVSGMPIYDRVNAFGKDHRNQFLWAQREIYLPSTLKELNNQSRPWRNSKTSIWGRFRCRCLVLPLSPSDVSTTCWAIARETDRCSLWGGLPNGFSHKFFSLAVSAGEPSPTLTSGSLEIPHFTLAVATLQG